MGGGKGEGGEEGDISIPPSLSLRPLLNATLNPKTAPAIQNSQAVSKDVCIVNLCQRCGEKWIGPKELLAFLKKMPICFYFHLAKGKREREKTYFIDNKDSYCMYITGINRYSILTYKVQKCELLK